MYICADISKFPHLILVNPNNFPPLKKASIEIPFLSPLFHINFPCFISPSSKLPIYDHSSLNFNSASSELNSLF